MYVNTLVMCPFLCAVLCDVNKCFCSVLLCYKIKRSIMSESASNWDRGPATEKIHNDNRTCAVQLGPIRPSIIEFPQSNQGSKKYRFSKNWYNEFEWIEYLISQDAAFGCLCRCFGTLGEYS